MDIKHTFPIFYTTNYRSRWLNEKRFTEIYISTILIKYIDLMVMVFFTCKTRSSHELVYISKQSCVIFLNLFFNLKKSLERDNTNFVNQILTRVTTNSKRIIFWYQKVLLTGFLNFIYFSLRLKTSWPIGYNLSEWKI